MQYTRIRWNQLVHPSAHAVGSRGTAVNIGVMGFMWDFLSPTMYHVQESPTVHKIILFQKTSPSVFSN